jgi:probable F420-dependent oxidoreductase
VEPQNGMKVGVALPLSDQGQGVPGWQRLAALAQHAEAGGIDSLWVFDHLLYPANDEPESGPYEAWTALTAVAAVTSRVEVGSLVLATAFREPALLAKMAATADVVADGRLILGLGCGWLRSEFDAFGFPFDHRVDRFEESLSIIDPLLRGERVTFDGRWHRTSDAVLLPPPARRPTILIGAKGPRMLRLTARHADAWNTIWFGLPDDSFRQRRAALREACEAEDRDPDSIQVTVGLVVEGGPEAPRYAVQPDAGAVSDALRAWAAEGVAHVQIVAPPMDEQAYDLISEAADRAR